MQTKFLRTVFLLTAIALLLSVPSFADTQSLQTQQPECLDAVLAEPGIETMASSSSNPFKAYLVINTNSYAAPDPYTGYFQEVVPANTNIWIVEKVYCSSYGRYFYYAGYTYNSQSHRGYFCEDNVYYNGALLSNSNISLESNPAELKQQTSLAGTVYDGPGTSYATMGSVGQETINLIRTEGDYNFIEYTVTSNNTKKRGYLHYSKITGSWASLTEQYASTYDGKTFYLKNKGSYQFLTADSTGENTRLSVKDFTGQPNQIFKFTYNSTGKYFTIQPASGYNVNRRLALNHSNNTQHADKHIAMKTSSGSDSSQRFWVVPVGDRTMFKILPIDNYGTMSITYRSGYANQHYTLATNYFDAWEPVDTTVEINASYYSQEDKNWCWAASAKSMASAEEGFNPNAGYNSNIDYENPDSELEPAIFAYRGNAANNGGTVQDRARLANLFSIGRHTDPLIYSYFNNKIYTESVLRRFIMDGHAVGVSMENSISNHAITVMKFRWVDTQGSAEAGYYQYYYYNSNLEELSNPRMTSYNKLVNAGIELGTGNMYWTSTAVYSTSYCTNTIDITA